MEQRRTTPEAHVPSLKSIHTLILDSPPSCIEFCKALPDCFVVGTYELSKQSDTSTGSVSDEEKEEHDASRVDAQKRTGSLVLLRIDSLTVLPIHTTIIPSAVLDLHFSPHNPTCLCVATSTGALIFYRIGSIDDASQLPGASSGARLHHVQEAQLFALSTLVLSCAWHPEDPKTVGVSLSTGEVVVIRLSSHLGPEKDARVVPDDMLFLYVHNDQAWTMAFSLDGSGVFSGGDDSVLGYCDNRHGTPRSESLGVSRAAVQDSQYYHGVKLIDSKLHGAGVTAILAISESLILTGSYDDKIRLLRTSPMRKPVVLAQMDLGGGVWRLNTVAEIPTVQGTCSEKSIQPGSRWIILASCMYAGVRLLEMKYSKAPIEEDQKTSGIETAKRINANEGDWTFRVLHRFEEHESMNYGSDVQPQDRGTSPRTFVSTSFYDRRLCLWQYQLS